MKHLRVMAGALAAVMLCCACAAAAGQPTASVMLVWSVPAPPAQSRDVQALEAGLVAINFLEPALAALDRHSAAKFTVAADPAFLDSLERAAAGSDVLAAVAARALHPGDPDEAEFLDALTATVVPATDLELTRAASRFASSAAEVRLARMQRRAVRMSHEGEIDYAASAVLLSLAGNGLARGQGALLARNALDARDLISLARQFASACEAVLAHVKRDAKLGTLELAALPAYEPILPLLIDAAGRDQHVPFTVALGAGADATAAVDEGIRAVRALDPAHADPGVVSPSGAYDDETAALLQERHAAYGVFSERVVTENVGAAQGAVASARGAAFVAYLMETSKTSSLPLLFCADQASETIDAQPASSPAAAMADRTVAAVASALAAMPGEAPAVVLCLPATGSILHRADRSAALDDIAGALSGGNRSATTPRRYLHDHPPTADTYGYAAASDAGGFDLWMGSSNHVSMWNALADARAAAGGDAGLTNPEVRDALLRAESGRWFLALGLPQPRYLTEAALDGFRARIARIYRAAHKAVPQKIAPVKFAPEPVASPGSG